MKLLSKILFALISVFLLNGFSSCTGTEDDTVDPTVYLTANKRTIDANGKDVVTFTVIQSGVDISKKATIVANDSITVKDAAFSTTKDGNYSFVAKYNGYESEPVNVVANKVKESSFVRKVCVMEFTATGCSNCPDGYRRISNIMRYYEDRAYLMAFHPEEYGGHVDPFYIKETDELCSSYKILAYPYTLVDMRKSAAANSLELEPALESSYSDYPSHCGVAVSSLYSSVDNSADITVKLYSEKEEQYRIAVYVVEDGITAWQLNGSLSDDNYYHRHVTRRLLSSSINGDAMGSVPSGTEVEKQYKITLDSSWNLDNLYIYAMAIDENGYVNNMNVCVLSNGDSGYSYVEE